MSENSRQQMSIIRPSKEDIAVYSDRFISPYSAPSHTLLFNALWRSSTRRFAVDKLRECPKNDLRNADCKCHKRMSSNGNHCLGVHGVVMWGPYDGVYVER